jgi:two-component system cell cycle response regulator
MAEVKRQGPARLASDKPDAPVIDSQKPVSGTRAVQKPRASVDSLLLDYLNRPTSPGMPAVHVTITNPAPAHSGVPTAPPGRSGIPTAPPRRTPPSVEFERSEDDRPTGRWDTTPPSDPRTLVRDRGVLVRLDGDASGEVLTLAREPMVIGRSTRAQIHINEPSVSREHARVSYEFGSYFVEDGDSQNGTFVAGRKVRRAELRDGDLIQLGQRATYRFAMMDETQEKVMRRLYESSMKDALTGADNRRLLDARLAAEVAFAQRHHQALCVILLDIDFFKNVNDRYGHPGGDEVLKCVADVIRGQLRTEDVFARYGGEEFAIVLRDTLLEDAALVADRVRDRISKTVIPISGVNVVVTVSAGCASLEAAPMGGGVDDLIAIADSRLYRAKRGGRNRVIASDDT